MVRGRSILGSEETLSLIEKAQAGDLQARHRLIESNIGLVHKIAQKWNVDSLTMEFDDLLMHGVLGLDKAISNYNSELQSRKHPGQPPRFSQHAASWIRSFIGHAVEDTGAVIRIPRYALTLYRQVEAEQKRWRDEMGREPEEEDLRRLFPEAGAAVIDAIIAGKPQACALLSRVDEEGDGEEPVFDAPSPECFEREVLNRLWVSWALDQLPNNPLPDNTPRRGRRAAWRAQPHMTECRIHDDRWLLVHYFGLEGEEARTFRDIAALCGVNHTTIEDYVKRAVDRLRRCAIEPASI